MHAGDLVTARSSQHFPIGQSAINRCDIAATELVKLCLVYIRVSCAAVAAVAGVAAALNSAWLQNEPAECQQAAEQNEDTEFVNWSATHKVRPKQLFQPETTDELKQVVASCHASGTFDWMYKT